MDSNKFIELQRQMQENNFEVKNFLDEFSDWKNTVESKARKLGANNNNETEYPAIRNSLMKKQKKVKTINFLHFY